MFCPKCRSEYLEGVGICADCGTSLVEKIPVPERYRFVAILETFNLADIAVIKSILDDGGIEYFFLGENYNQIEQLAQPARLAVREDQVDDAREALKDIEVRYLGIASTADREDRED